jgi:hypothetical protein
VPGVSGAVVGGAGHYDDTADRLDMIYDGRP